MDKLKFGEFIYSKRKSLGLTQDDLGRKLGVTNKAVSKWETGETLPDIQILPMLASALDVTIDELLTQKSIEPTIIHAKPKKKLQIIQAIISLVFFVTALVLLIMLISTWTKKEKLTINNYNEYLYIDINSYEGLSNQSLKVSGEVIELKEIDDLSITINFTVKYIYLNEDNDKCEILYLNRETLINENDHTFILISNIRF